MSTRKSPRLPREVLESATTWFVEFHEGEPDLSAREEFIDWLRTSPEHVRAYLQVTSHWEEAGTLATSRQHNVNELIALARSQSNIVRWERTHATQEEGTPQGEGLALALEGDGVSPAPRAEPVVPGAGSSLAPPERSAVVPGGGSSLAPPEHSAVVPGAGSSLAAPERSAFAHKRPAPKLQPSSPDPQRSSPAAVPRQVPPDATLWRRLIRVPRSQQPPRRFALIWVTASMISLLGAAVVVRFVAERDAYDTRIGEQRHVVLTDGSTIDLDSRSQVRVHYQAEARYVELLAGQAFFKVAKDPSRPFIVRAGGTSVRAVGTQFDVYRRQTGTTVTVVEGHVAVFDQAATDSARLTQERTEPAASVTLLGAGEQLTVTATTKEKSPHPDVTAATAWTQKKIVLSDTPLIEVASEFNRYNTRPIVIIDSRLNDIRISGNFSSTDPTSLLRGLEALGRFRVREMPDRVEISAK